MDEMKFALLKYENEPNLGDEIQSLAAMQFLHRVDAKFDRNNLTTAEAATKHLLIMNGWFSQTPEKAFPPSDSILPIFVSFHIANTNESIRHFLSASSIEFFKKHEPIGCRDRKTMDMLRSKGVDAFYSKCLTITFPARKKEPEHGKIFLVDLDKRIPLPRRIRKGAIRVSHIVPPYISDETKFKLARELLDMYRDEAKLVITTRLHCALPCIAMGIPVIFFGDPKDYRISILKDLGLDINRYVLPKGGLLRLLNRLYLFMSAFSINWNPKPLRIEAEQEKLRKLVKDKVSAVVPG